MRFNRMSYIAISFLYIFIVNAVTHVSPFDLRMLTGYAIVWLNIYMLDDAQWEKKLEL